MRARPDVASLTGHDAAQENRDMTQKNWVGDVLLAMWPEVSRHIEIHQAAAAIAQLLSPHTPVASLTVRRINLAGSCLETLAVGVVGSQGRARLGKTECTPAQAEAVVAWCRRGALHHGKRGELAADVRCMVPADAATDLLVGPLAAPEGPAGVLILAAARGMSFRDVDRELLAAMLEPFSVALANDRHLRELAQLREAAEADRRALLTKLGRQEVTAPIVGAEAGLRPVLDRVAVVAPSDAPVLLFGETGTGKEVIARAIHTRSPRAGGPFLRVNCGAIPPELIDSQLFGHERGSFTGATDMRKGWFERADGGTLFLDEIGELPPAAQVRLLRVLQDGSLERVGAQDVLHVDVRVVGATHHDLAAMVAEGAFRQDLWYRLAVFPISIPPLRDRTEDIEILAGHFAEKAAMRFGLPLVMPTADDIRLLQGYIWPGNVRELAAVIDRAALLGNGRALEIATALGAAPLPGPAALPGRREVAARVTAAPEAASRESGGGDAAGASLDDVMRECIETALRICHGRVEGPFGAATRLRVNPDTLRSRMRKLGIEWKRYRS
jgi:hydrogenase-4 transcriptional activator